MYMKKPYHDWTTIAYEQMKDIRSSVGLIDMEYLIKCKTEDDYLLVRTIYNAV